MSQKSLYPWIIKITAQLSPITDDKLYLEQHYALAYSFSYLCILQWSTQCTLKERLIMEKWLYESLNSGHNLNEVFAIFNSDSRTNLQQKYFWKEIYFFSDH